MGLRSTFEKKVKYGDLLPNTRAELEEIRNTLNEMLIDRGLQYPE